MNRFPALQIYLYSKDGLRLYLNESERSRFKKAAHQSDLLIRAFCLFLFFTGSRPSEALNVRIQDVQWSDGVLSIRSLKKRGEHDPREIPIPEELLNILKSIIPTSFSPSTRLWSINRSTAWRWVKHVMRGANIYGPMASAKGLRHSFCVHALSSGVFLHIVQKWMGHSSIEVTVQYARIIGAEERAMAQKMWD